MSKNKIKVRKVKDITIVELQHEKILDETLINTITDTVFDVIEQNTPIKLLLSFARVHYLSSSMLGVLIRLSKRTVESGGTMKLCSISPSLYEMFVITSLNRLFDIYDNEQVGLISF